jgi:release factor glutamine methyltransferase
MSDTNLNPTQSSFFTQKRGFFASGEAVWRWWKMAQESAIAANIPVNEATWLLQELSELTRLDLCLERFKDQPQIALSIPLEDLVQRWQQRIQHRVPVQYLTGKTSWRNFQLQVSTAVLIPRPETELLIDLALLHARSTSDQDSDSISQISGDWADLGTGSGAIALGLASAFPHARIHAVDCSQAALEIAQANAATYALSDRIHFYQGRWFDPLEMLKGRLSGMVSNPPYIPSQTVLNLQPEVTRHEPHLALDGGNDGLECIRHLVAAAPSVVELLCNNGNYGEVQIHQDFAGIERFVSAYMATDE